MTSSDDAIDLRSVFSGRRVLVTGHTGFKGTWLVHWLHHLGAEVTGFALPPETDPSIFVATDAASLCDHRVGDLGEADSIAAVVAETRPEFVLHLGAQALVRRSYRDPLETIRSNILGTAHLLDAVRRAGTPCAVVVVSSDKCYENRESWHGYRESDPMGGHDIYSMSKGATELVTSSYRRSFFNPARLSEHAIAVGSGRAGNVVGGGDWAEDRLVPDIVRAIAAGDPAIIRNPVSVRPWQHVLEPLGGYLVLAAHLAGHGRLDTRDACTGWNFGPNPTEVATVGEVADRIVSVWGQGHWQHDPPKDAPKEAGLLRLSIDQAVARLGWRPRWSLHETIDRTVEWYRAHAEGASTDALRSLTATQIETYTSCAPRERAES